MSTERSLSRGRGLQSIGRGGAGNIRSPSKDPLVGDGPEDFSDTRGRDLVPGRNLDDVISTGRGGAGNIRSPSRDATRAETVSIDSSPSRRGRGYDRDLISTIDTAHDNGVHSTGRGGLGNITRPDSNSRSRSRDPMHTVGRGGAGNLYVGDPIEKSLLEADEHERADHQHPPGIHSTGRGGAANLTPGAVPHIEVPHGANHPHEYVSSGRGGVGNIADRSRSREPRDPNDKDHDHGLTGFLHRVAHPGTHKVEHDGVQDGEVLTAGVGTRQPVL